MLKSTLLDIVRTFSSEELIKFEDFVRSPYFNKKDIIVSLYSEIKKYSPEFNNEKLKREKVWEKLFPEREFNYGIMKNLIYDLSKLCEKFITQEVYNKNELRMFHDLIEEMDNRNLEKVLSTRLLTFDKNFNIEKAKHSRIFSNDYYYILSKIYWIKIFNDTKNLNSGFEKERNIASEYMIYGFLINLFRIYDNLRVMKFNDRKNSNSDIVDLFLELLNKGDIKKILDYSKTKSQINFKILNCYHAMYKSVSSFENEDYYFNFKSSISEISDLVNEYDLRYLYINLMNALINQKSKLINKEKEIADIYNIMISKNIFIGNNGVLEANAYNNYIIAQSNLNNYADVENFISQFTDKLSEDKRENSFNFAMAHLNFLKCEYFKSLEYISKINFIYFDMKYYVKNLQMMNYYELNDYESFVFAFDSYKHFTVKNKNIIEPWKIRTSAFFNTVNSLFQLRNNFDEYSFIKLKKEITGSLPSRKPWLLKKIEELETISNDQ